MPSALTRILIALALLIPVFAAAENGGREAVKKSGLSQALAKGVLIRKDLGEARLTVPACFHSFLPSECASTAGS